MDVFFYCSFCKLDIFVVLRFSLLKSFLSAFRVYNIKIINLLDRSVKTMLYFSLRVSFCVVGFLAKTRG